VTLLDTEQQSQCRAAFDYSLRGMFTDMDRCLAKLTPQSQAALLLAIDTIVSAIRLEGVARAALAPDSLPERSAIANTEEIADDLDVSDRVPLPIGVEGHAIVGGRTR